MSERKIKIKISTISKKISVTVSDKHEKGILNKSGGETIIVKKKLLSCKETVRSPVSNQT